jgi:hypothetical protein
MTLDVESVLRGSASGEKPLCCTSALETLHLAILYAGGLMQVFGPIVPPLTALMAALDPKVARPAR